MLLLHLEKFTSNIWLKGILGMVSKTLTSFQNSYNFFSFWLCCCCWPRTKHKTEAIIRFGCVIIRTYFYHCNFCFKFMRLQILLHPNNGHLNHQICGRNRIKSFSVAGFKIEFDRNFITQKNIVTWSG